MVSINRIKRRISNSGGYLKNWVKSFSGSLTVLLIVIFALLPLFSQDPEYQNVFIYTVSLAFIYAILAASWDLISGITGQANFGQAIFFGIGGYITAALIVDYSNKLPLILPIIMGVLVATIFGLMIGLPALRLKGPYLMLISLVFSIILLKLFAMGTLAPILRGNEGILIPPIMSDTVLEYYILFISLIVVFVFLLQLSKSKFGTILKSIRDDEVGSDASGINTMRYKIFAFLISAMLAGLAGIYFLFHFQTVNPAGNLSAGISFEAILMASLGGIATIRGSLLGAFFFVFLQFILVEIGFEVNFVRILFAVILLVVVRFASRGILSPVLERLKDIWDVLLGR